MSPLTRLFPLAYGLYMLAYLAVVWQKGMWSVVGSGILWSLLFASLFMAGLFAAAYRTKRYDMVDVGWGLCSIVVVSTSYALGNGGVLQTLVTVLVYVWGLRLAWHIGRRIRRATHEDRRYVELRKSWRGSVLINTFFRVYMAQAVLTLLVCVPVVHVNLAPNGTWSLLAAVGLVVWVLGFLCEVVADQQLANFLGQPKNKGRLMTKGLWKHARYPNYFGEITMWWGIALVSLGTSYGWVGLGGAAVITYLIIYVSGIPPKEAGLRSKPGWQQYVRQTRLLVPLRRFITKSYNVDM